MPGLADRCGVCARQFNFSLARCGFCHKAVCGDCLTRMAGSVFCGRTCSHAFFYGGDEEIDERSDPEADEGE